MKIDEGARIHEIRHHFQRKFRKLESPSIDYPIRAELAAEMAEGHNVPDNMQGFIDFYRELNLKIVRGKKRKKPGTKRAEESRAREIEEIKKQFQAIEARLQSQRFQLLIGEAQLVVPKRILASYIESVSLPRLEILLPELIEKYKKKRGRIGLVSD